MRKGDLCELDPGGGPAVGGPGNTRLSRPLHSSNHAQTFMAFSFIKNLSCMVSIETPSYGHMVLQRKSGGDSWKSTTKKQPKQVGAFLTCTKSNYSSHFIPYTHTRPGFWRVMINILCGVLNNELSIDSTSQ